MEDAWSPRWVVEALEGGISGSLPGPEVRPHEGGPQLYLLPHLRVAWLAGKGRGLLAARALPRGTLLAVEPALGAYVSSKRHCTRCARALPDQTEQRGFCSAGCEAEERRRWQWLDCQAEEALLARDKNVGLAASLLAATPPHLRRLWSQRTRLQLTDRLPAVFANPEAYIALAASLPTHDDIPSRRTQLYDLIKPTILQVAKFFARQDRQASIHKTMKQLFHIYMVLSTNCFCIYSEVGRKKWPASEWTLREELAEVEVGAGLFPAMSLLNHSCLPNTARYFQGTTMIMRVVRDVAAGEELTTTYGPDVVRVNTFIRRLSLSSWGFHCACAEACGSELFLLREAEFWGFACPHCCLGPALPRQQGQGLHALLDYVANRGCDVSVLTGQLHLACLRCQAESTLSAEEVRETVLGVLVLYSRAPFRPDLARLLRALHPRNRFRLLAAWVLQGRRARREGRLDGAALRALLAAHGCLRRLAGDGMAVAEDALHAVRAIAAFPGPSADAACAKEELASLACTIASAHYGPRGEKAVRRCLSPPA